MIKRILLSLLFVFALMPAAQAYSPPPATIILPWTPEPPCEPLPPPCDPLPLSSTIAVELPPRLIVTPDKLLFPDGAVYIFEYISGVPYFRPDSGTGYTVLVSTKNKDVDGEYYVVSITGIKKDDLPSVRNFRMTFKEPISKENVDKVENYLRVGNSVDTARLTNAACATGPDTSQLCLDTITTVSNRGTKLPSAHLLQTIATRGTFVPGNVVAPGEISGFSLTGQSLAVGGTVRVSGGTKLEGYLDNQSAISWNKIESQLDKIFRNRDSAQKSDIIDNPYLATSWQLNSSDRYNPNASATSLSSPPEGKLWNVTVNSSNFTYGNGNGAINFSGSGTVVFSRSNGQNENVNLTFNGPITCSPNTRLAFITKGNIVFRPSSTGEVTVGCGSYTSLDGDINFAPTPHTVKAGQITGIFIAKNSIVLPVADELTSTFNIYRDDVFATNPTVLLRELLKLVFSPS
ncbi:MAG: hypothetical protein AAB563_02635 [Patescibacteria group bacterium]